MTILPTSCRFAHQVMLAIQAAACACQVHPFLIGLAAVKGLTKDQIPTAPNLGRVPEVMPYLPGKGTLGPNACMCASSRNGVSAALLSVVNLDTIVSLPFELL